MRENWAWGGKHANLASAARVKSKRVRVLWILNVELHFNSVSYSLLRRSLGRTCIHRYALSIDLYHCCLLPRGIDYVHIINMCFMNTVGLCLNDGYSRPVSQNCCLAYQSGRSTEKTLREKILLNELGAICPSEN